MFSVAAIWLTLASGARVGELLGAIRADSLPAGLKARTDRLIELQEITDANDVKLAIADFKVRTWHAT